MNKVWFNLKRCKVFFEECKKEIVITLFLSMVISIIMMVAPSLNGKIINNVVSFNFKAVIIFAVLNALLQIIYTAFNMLVSNKNLNIRKVITNNIRNKVCKVILDLNINVYNIYGQGSITNKLKVDSKNISTFFNNVRESIFSLITSVGILIYICYLNIFIGIFYLIAIVLSVFFQYYGVKKSIYYRKKLLEEEDNNLSLINQMIKGAKDIKALKLKDKILDKTQSSFAEVGEYEYKSNLYLEYASKSSKFLSTLFSGVIIVLSVLLIKFKLLTTSAFVIIFMYRSNIFTFSNKLSTIINNFAGFNLSVDRIFSIIDYNKDGFGTEKIKKFTGTINISNISYGYDEKPIFKNFNLILKPKTFTIITGSNGAGKSTLFSLLTCMIRPQEGNVFWDKTDVLTLSEEEIRNNIVLVTQQPFIFDFTVKENLGLIDNDLKHIKEVCKLVGIDKKIESMPNGYDTKITSDANNLSGGEKQKLAIARALLAKTKVLLFDEITNNLDNDTIKSILNLILKLKDKYTIVMITHNRDILSNADRIIMLEKGIIVADGVHDDLIKSNNKYQKLFKEV